MKHILFSLFFIFAVQLFGQNISGRIVTDGEMPLASVLVMNMSTNVKAHSDSQGHFTISASINDELRFARAGFERSSVTISSPKSTVYVNMIPTYREIEAVRVNPVKLSGDLSKDSKLLTRTDKNAQLQKDIGVPTAPENPRETPPPSIEKVGTLVFILSNLNLNNLYKNISGDARRMRNLYKLEDQQSDVSWIRERIDDDYFIKVGIPQKRIAEFIEFSFSQNPDVRKYVHAKNLPGVMLAMEAALASYLGRLKQ